MLNSSANMPTDAIVELPIFLTTPLANSSPVDGSTNIAWLTILTVDPNLVLFANNSLIGVSEVQRASYWDC